jgi:hypothetical protein
LGSTFSRSGLRSSITQVADVVLNELDVVEAQLLLRVARLGEVGLADLQAHDLGAVQRKLDAVLTFEAGQVEHARLGQRLT